MSKTRCLLVALLCATNLSTPASAQLSPPWKSFAATGNTADKVPATAVASEFGTKVDVTGGKLTNPTMTGSLYGSITVVGSILVSSTLGNLPRSLADWFSDRVTPQQFGAACNGNVDDAVAFQQAAISAAANNRPLWLRGHCLVGKEVDVSAFGDAASFTIQGNNARIDTHSNNLFVIEPATAAGIVADVGSFTMNNLDGNGHGMAVVYDNSVPAAAFAGFANGSKVHDVTGYDVGQMIELINTSGVKVTNYTKINKTVDASAGLLMRGIAETPTGNAKYTGSVQGYVSSTIVDVGYTVNTDGVIIDGGNQGLDISHLKVLQAQYGITESGSIVGGENWDFHDNYLEGSLAGINMPIPIAFLQIHHNSFDILPATASNTWSAILVGSPSAASQGQGTAIDDNMVFAIVGHTTATVILVYGIYGISVTNNMVVGNVATAHCIQAGAPSGTAAGSDVTVISGNACWTSGDISDFTGNAIARGNRYTSSASPYNLMKFEQN